MSEPIFWLVCLLAVVEVILFIALICETRENDRLKKKCAQLEGSWPLATAEEYPKTACSKCYSREWVKVRVPIYKTHPHMGYHWLYQCRECGTQVDRLD